MEVFDKQLKSLHAAFSGIEHYQRIVDSNTKKLLADLLQSKNNLSAFDSETKEIFGSSVNAFYFQDPYTGAARPYDAKRTSIEESIELAFLYKNKQYQWLLSEAYEAFEDYLEAMYASAGFLDPGFINPKDLDGHHPALAKINGFDWFLERAKKKKDAPRSILGHFRREFPELVRMERGNKINADLRLSICLIEKLRHIIVHKHGKTEIRNQVVDAILESACLLKDKTLEPAARRKIEDHLGIDAHDGLVVLIERPVFQNGGFSMTINRHSNLISEMLAYSFIVRNELVKRFSAGAA